MFEFKAEQKKFKIGKVNVGGLPGERPTVLIGSIFYHKQKIVLDVNKGDFNREKAEELIKLQEEFSDKTGNPCMLDVIGATPEAMRKALDFTAGITETPIVMDGTSPVVRVAGLEYVKESGLSSRVVYSSLTPEFKPEEVDKIREVGVESAILLAYNIREFTTEGRVKTIKKLLPISSDAGVNKPLIDTCVLDVPSLGQACKAIFLLKDELGLPVGCGAHNAIGTWRGLKKKMGEQTLKPSVASSMAITAMVGADFILYGPIESASYVFPAVAMVDVAHSQLLIEKGKKIGAEHPRYKVA